MDVPRFPDGVEASVLVSVFIEFGVRWEGGKGVRYRSLGCRGFGGGTLWFLRISVYELNGVVVKGETLSLGISVLCTSSGF